MTNFGRSSQDHEAASPPRTGSVGADRLLDALALGVLVLSRDLHITYANTRWHRWLGAPLLPGERLSVLLAGEPDRVERELGAVLADGEPRTVPMAVHCAQADGALRLMCVVQRVGDGLVVEAHLESDDDLPAMNDFARRLAEVTDMAEVLRTLCDIATRQCGASGAAVLRVLDGQGEVVAAAGDLEPARGRCFDLAGSLLMEAINEQRVVTERDYGRSDRPLLRVVPELALGPMLVAPLRAHGETLGVIAIARGVDGRAFRTREIERLGVLADHAALAVHKSRLLLLAQSADKAKGRFLATISHELRTPLTALAGYNELLIDQVIGPVTESQLDILERMRSVTTHLSAMIEEILAFTNLEEGREVVRPTDFLAADLVRAAVAVVQPLADQKHLTLQLSLPGMFIRMSGDIDKSRQIIVNLMGNAVKFTESGSVVVTLRPHGNSVRIEVKDSGIGIPEDELMRLFRPFAQVDSGLTRRYGGTGLGLYISRRLATLLGGHIEVYSEPGQGSTFTVALPLVWRPPA